MVLRCHYECHVFSSDLYSLYFVVYGPLLLSLCDKQGGSQHVFTKMLLVTFGISNEVCCLSHFAISMLEVQCFRDKNDLFSCFLFALMAVCFDVGIDSHVVICTLFILVTFSLCPWFGS